MYYSLKVSSLLQYKGRPANQHTSSTVGWLAQGKVYLTPNGLEKFMHWAGSTNEGKDLSHLGWDHLLYCTTALCFKCCYSVGICTRITTRSRCQMISGLHCALHTLVHCKMKRVEIRREVRYGFADRIKNINKDLKKCERSSKAGISTSFHCMFAPLHHWWPAGNPYRGQAKLMPTGRNCTSQKHKHESYTGIT